MGIFDWLGTGKRRGWSELPAVPSTTQAAWPLGEIKTSPTSLPPGVATGAFTVRTLVHAPAGGYAWTPDTPYGSSANSAVAACLAAVARSVAEPDLLVYRVTDGERIAVPDTELGRLLDHPNAVFDLDTMLSYVATCLDVDGNAYWRKLRAGDPETGNVVELWPISPSRITPRTERGSEQFIDVYRYYYTSSNYVDLDPSQVVHFRNGIDDRDHRLGLSPLRRLAREIGADEQATRYAERLLANLAVNGLTLSFDKDAPSIDQATADELKARITAAYGGDNVGAAAVLSPGATLTALGFSPEQMDMKTLHRVPEERISAVLGVPAIVAGLGAGLDRSTYANFKEANERFTEGKLIPLWRALAATLTLQLVPDFSGDPSVVVDFDLSNVRALADDQTATATRLKTLVDAGIIDEDEARAEIGLPPRGPVVVRTAASRRVTARTAVSAPITPIATPRALRESKAAEDLPREYGRMREDELPDWERELTAFLEQQLRRVTRRLRAGADMADELVPEGEAVLLGETLTPLQLRVLGEVERLVASELGIEFRLDDPATRAYLRSAGQNIVGITDTTRRAVADALIEGQTAGEGIDELAQRLRDLPAFGRPRAETVARTELGHAQNTAALTTYGASGVVVGIRVHDGDYDAECEAMDGRVFPLDAAPPTLQHPRCVRAFAPIVDADEMTRSA